MGVEDLSFEELVEIMASFEQENEPSDVDRAIQRAAVERRLMAMLSAGHYAERRAHVRVPGDLRARIYRDTETVHATVRDLCEGGLRLSSPWGPPMGATLDIEVLGKPSQVGVLPPRAPVVVAWVTPLGDAAYDFGVRFIGHDDAHRRRMRRVVVELLRRIPLATTH